jgi:polar amino acid transport system substrate-binding protein
MSFLRLPNALIDLVALLILISYGLLAWGVEHGSQAAGPTLDPVLAAARERGSLRVAVDLGFRPFADLGPTGEPIGYDIDLARAIAARLEMQIEFVPTGFDGLYDTLTSGRADLIASALPYAPEQGFRARFSSVYFDAGQLLLIRAGAPIDGLEDLAGRSVGVALGSDADALARRLATDAAFTLRSDYDEPAEALADLRAGQLDAIIADAVTALSAQNSDPRLEVVAALSSEPLVLAMARPAFQLESEVNRALEELRREGFFDELNARWLK